jgi:hypothetical protein
MAGDINVDLSGVPQSEWSAISSLFSSLGRLFGMEPSGTVHEDGATFCILNDWEGRDSRARAEGTFDDGRFSFAGGGIVGGRWYCCKKRGH